MSGSAVDYSHLPKKAAKVLTFWFDELRADKKFVRDDAVDRTIANRFGKLHEELSAEAPESWLADPRGILAAIIVLDQFSRNLHRDDGRAFAQDGTALALAKQAIAAGQDADLNADEKQFLYMPLMHSEELADVEHCTELMHKAGIQSGADFSQRHAACIARFGRYPARNAALGRHTTAEEATFLAFNPMGF